MSVYRFELLKFDEIDKLIPLMEHCFDMKIDMEYFNWKYIQNPAGKLIGFVAKDINDSIVAFEGMMPELYNIDNKETIIYQSTDTMTHSDHRCKGLFKELSTRIYDYLEENNNLFIVGFGGPMSTKSLIKLGWETLFEIPFYFRSSPQIKISSAFSSKKNKNTSYKVKEISNLFDIKSIIQINRNNTRISKVIDYKLLLWKTNNSRMKIKTVAIYNQDNALGYIMYYYENNKIMILDANFYSDDSLIEKTLFKHIDKIVINENLKGIVTFSQKNTTFSKYLKRNGYISNKLGFGALNRPLPFMYYTDKNRIDKFLNIKNWSITPLYHDSF